MVFDSYARNTRNFQRKLGLMTFDKSDLPVRGLVFKPGQGDEFRVSYRDMDVGTRIFFQYFGTRDGVRATGLYCVDLLHPDRAPAYFAELWAEDVDEFTHPAIWALKNIAEQQFMEVVLVWAF